MSLDDKLSQAVVIQILTHPHEALKIQSADVRNGGIYVAGKAIRNPLLRCYIYKFQPHEESGWLRVKRVDNYTYKCESAGVCRNTAAAIALRIQEDLLSDKIGRV